MADTDTLRARWGAEIRRRRTLAGLSLRGLSDTSGVEYSHLSKLERGEAGLSDDGRIGLAKALGCRVEELFSYDDTGPTAS
jgi:transcriptional regulator with XRE-family HTH domain